MLESLCKCVDIMGINCFTTEQYQSLVTHLQDTMRTYVEKTKERINKRNEEDCSGYFVPNKMYSRVFPRPARY